MTRVRSRKSHIWRRDPFDWYVEERWCVDRLFDVEEWPHERGKETIIYDPAAGIGQIVLEARRRGLLAHGTDVVRRRGDIGIKKRDFLNPSYRPRSGRTVSIVCNPPYKHARAFVAKALELQSGRLNGKVAMLLPASWLLGDERSRWLQHSGLSRVWLLTPRPSMPPGRVVQHARRGDRQKNGNRVGQGLVDYAWYVWDLKAPKRIEIKWLRRQA